MRRGIEDGTPLQDLAQLEVQAEEQPAAQHVVFSALPEEGRRNSRIRVGTIVGGILGGAAAGAAFGTAARELPAVGLVNVLIFAIGGGAAAGAAIGHDIMTRNRS